MSEQKLRLPLLLDTGALALGEYVVLDIDYKTVQCFATIEDAQAFIAEANGWQHSPGFQLNPPPPRISPIPRPVARSELFGGLLKSLSHIVPSRLSTLLEVLPRLGSRFAKLVELVAGYLLLGLEVSQLFVPACLGLVLQGVSLFMQPCDFFLHFRETGLEARLKVFLGLRGDAAACAKRRAVSPCENTLCLPLFRDFGWRAGLPRSVGDVRWLTRLSRHAHPSG